MARFVYSKTYLGFFLMFCGPIAYWVVFPIWDRLKKNKHQSLKRGFGIVVVIVAILLVAIALTPPPPRVPTQFSLTSWKVVDDGGCSYLLVSFDATDDVWLYLTDPDGVQRDSRFATKGIGGAELRMGTYRETPSPGAYTVLVKDVRGEILYTRKFPFEGADLSVTECIPGWKYREGLGYWELRTLRIVMRNNGDLPAYPRTLDISLDGGIDFTHLEPSDVVVLPNQEKTANARCLISEVSSGSHTMVIVFKGHSDNFLVTYTTTVECK